MLELKYEKYMRRCLELAAMAAGNVAPNPMVGAVLVHDDRIIGEGYHQFYGGPHAEVNCIKSVQAVNRSFIPGSTIYVSLEPCAHFGKTPPCADLIIGSGIKKVVIGVADVFAKVAGKGIERMRNHGIEVITGILERECQYLNRRFFTFHEKKRPYLILKWAQNGVGVIGIRSEERMFISNQFSNRLVHKWRAEEAAILIGKNTALLDDPSLTTRLWPGKNPTRILLDRYLNATNGSKIYNSEAASIVFNFLKTDGILVRVPEENFLEEVLRHLYANNIQSVIIEGGSQTLQSFIDAGLWDEARVITATSTKSHVTSVSVLAPVLKNACLTQEQKLLTDTISYYKNNANGDI